MPGSLWIAAGGILLLAVLSAAVFIICRKRKAADIKTPVTSGKAPQDINYDHLVAAIKKQNGRAGSLLLAAGSLTDLPVTVPVNLAMRLAETHKCLLVDLDVKRNAIARVFEIDEAAGNGKVQASSYPTSSENLFVWPARNFEVHRQMNLRALIDVAVKKYDYVLIYAPYLTTLPDRRQIAGCTRQAIAFTGQNGVRLKQLLQQCNCKVITEM